ncbi:hypothetical protein FRC07_004095 [Ceratobasidium sp. 392]|nr:hypothetical protein FRC07_004095 [Ceratobasidium sp. 392]
MAPNATTSEDVAMSSRSHITLTVVYQEDARDEKHYASIPISSRYKDALDTACECFEEYLPQNWEIYTIELQHLIGEDRWAVIHPSVFSEVAARIAAQSGEIRLRVRPMRNQSRHNTGNDNTVPVSPSTVVGSNGVGQRSSGTSAMQDPPPYATVVAPRTLVVDSPETPISDPRHDAFCPNVEKHYASVVASHEYKDVLSSACACFEEYFPLEWKPWTADLQHEIKPGQWAVIHPKVFAEIATDTFRLGEIKLRVRPARAQNTGNGQDGEGK